MVERRLVLTVSDREGVMYASIVFEHEIDRRVALHQDKTRPGCIKKGHVPARHSRQMLAPDNLRIEARAPRDVAHGAAEMGNGLDCNHPTLPSLWRPLRSTSSQHRMAALSGTRISRPIRLGARMKDVWLDK